MKNRIKFSSQAMRAVDMLALARNVVAKMTTNTNFPTPLVPLTTINAKADEVEAAIELATEGGKLARSQRDVLLAELADMLSIQADYVRSICNGERVPLISSGYELVKIPEPIGIPGITIIKDVTMTGVTGQVDIKWKTVKGAKVYQVWMTSGDPNDVNGWQPVAATHRISLTVDNLKSLSTYWFAISAIGAAGSGAKCDPARGIAA